MKKLIFKITVLSLALLFASCGSRVPFVEKEVTNDSALLYIYASKNLGDTEETSDPLYTLKLNNKRLEQKIRMNEYVVYYIKPSSVKLSAIRASIEEHSVTLELKAGQTYYLRVDGNLDNDNFSLTQVENSIALKEIKKTGLAGSTDIEEESIVTEIITDKNDQQKHAPSKSDEIKEAYKMKVNGLITQEEYNKLKTEILAK